MISANRNRAALRDCFINDKQPVSVAISQRTYDHRVDDAEYRGVCSNAESQCENRDGGEGRALPQLADRVSYVLHNAFDQRGTAGFAAFFFALLDAIDRAQGCVARILPCLASRVVLLRRLEK